MIAKAWNLFRRSFWMLATFALLGVFAWRLIHGADLKKADASATSKPQVAASFTLKDLDGKERSLESFRGKTVLVNFWATWCPPCRAELPELQETYAAHKSCFDVVGVAVDSGTAADVKAFAKQKGLTYPILMDDGSASSAYGIQTIPQSFLIDPQGRVLGSFNGSVTRAGVEKALGEVSAPVC